MINVDISWPRSIAQGSGGNFKKRKPVGEVGCCESRHFPVSSLSVSFLRFLWLSTYLFIYLSIYVSSHLSTYQSFKLPSYLATYLSTVSSYLSTYLSIYLSSHLFIYSYQDLALYLLICLSIHPSIHLSIYLSISIPPKVARDPHAFNILTLKCASRHNSFSFSTSIPPKVVRDLHVINYCHNGVQFFAIYPAKIGPSLVCSVHFDWEMRSVQQQRVILYFSSGQMAPHSAPTIQPLPTHKMIGKKT